MKDIRTFLFKQTPDCQAKGSPLMSRRQRIGLFGAWAVCLLLVGAIPSAQALDLYLFAAPPGSGTVIPSTVLGLSTGQVRQIQAYANNGYRFVSWQGDVTTVANIFSNITTVVMSNDYYITAVFESTLAKYSLTVTNDGNGTTAPSGTETDIPSGTLKTIAAFPSTNPPPGYVFDRWDGAAGVEDPTKASTRIVVDNNKTVIARFRKLWTITQYQPRGPGSAPTSTNVPQGAEFTVAVPSEFVQTTTNFRYRCTGWTDGSGDILSSGVTLSYGPFVVTQSSSNRWTWIRQYGLNISQSPGGIVTPEAGVTHYYDDGQIVVLTASPLSGYRFTGWTGDTNAVGSLTLVMNRPWSVRANFTELTGDSDNDGLPDWWEQLFGLDPLNPSGVNGPVGDPDRDGLNNFNEFLISNTNINPSYSSPVNADTDGDEMDDFYEKFYIGPTNMQGVVVGEFIPPGLDDGRYRVENGPNGNPDGDWKWSTTDGYEGYNESPRIRVPLTNIEEWTGPDGIVPLVYSNISFGHPDYPFPMNAAGNRPDFVRIAYTNSSDTRDQSRGNNTDSDEDTFDDGYEYSWDRWHQAHAGSNEVFEVGPHGATITNTIPPWPAQRRFNPAVQHPDMPGLDRQEGDVLYDYASGGVSGYWYSDVREYTAWQEGAFSPDIAEAPKTIRRDFYPNRKRSSHPFLIDVDQDGLPDGWEVIFGYDPWARISPGATIPDGAANPDGDFMAFDGTNRHNEVYVLYGFDPRTGWGQFYPTPGAMPGPGGSEAPNTRPYNNVEESRGPDGALVYEPLGITTMTEDATKSYHHDSDGDGMWDGWEAYVGLNPNSASGGASDAAADGDGDGLNNLDEFLSFVTSSTNRNELMPLVSWMNKIFPTDPNAEDTDGDGLSDSRERGHFNNVPEGILTNLVYNTISNDFVAVVTTNATWGGKCYTGGGLNPCSADTDNDGLPDPWEATYEGPANGTASDIAADPDGDGLKNYQEYLTLSVYHWQYDFWPPGQAYYHPADFYVGVPKHWDWYTELYDLPYFYVPFLSGPGEHPYSSTDPGDADSDEDGMDDYYEVFHGLNPVYGHYDLVLTRIFGGDYAEVPSQYSPAVADPRVWPFVNGTVYMDSDGDGLPNQEEALGPKVLPERAPGHHTDPTPFWITDPGYANSWVNLYYRPWWEIWYWVPGIADLSAFEPTYIFDFEINEGFDTDNDNFGDYMELNVTLTDPLDAERPVRRRALLLPPGREGYARTMPTYWYNLEALRSFTIEAWVRPAQAAMGRRQIVMERPFLLPQGNPLNLAPGIRANFRLALDPDGRPYVEYDGAGTAYGFSSASAKAGGPIPSDQWTHLAATYSVSTLSNSQGRLTLFVNGQVARIVDSGVVPANGRFGLSNKEIVTFGAPLVVGAADANPPGIVNGYAALPEQPMPYDFFEGWIDEVRVWDGARTPAQVQANMSRRMKRADVLASRGTSAELYYLCTFDDLPDPDHDGMSPPTFPMVMSGIAPLDWPAIPWWANANDKSLQYTDYQYIPWIENTAAHVPFDHPLDVGDPEWLSTTNEPGGLRFRNPANSYAMVYRTDVDFQYQEHPFEGKFSLVGPSSRARIGVLADLMPLRWAVADADVEMWDGGGVPSQDDFDSDGDGLPDWWEELYGLDPLDPTGENGTYGDPDMDGLSNVAERQAGTSPVMYDTFEAGFSDFYNWSGNVYRIFGEIYTDFDGMEDVWELANGLDPRLYDAHLDSDGDGWSNVSEFQEKTSPFSRTDHPVPEITFNLKYTGLRTAGNLRILAYSSAAMDGMPDAVFTLQDQPSLGASEELPSALVGTLSHGDVVPGTVQINTADDNTFLDNGSGGLVGMLRGAGTIDYASGAWTLTYTNPVGMGYAVSAAYRYRMTITDYPMRLTFTQVAQGYLREGDNYFFAFIDRNGNAIWDEGEPAGIAYGQPIDVRRGSVEVTIGLTDSLPGFGRFSWPALPDYNAYNLAIFNMSVTGGPQVVSRVMRAPRTWFHEGDALYAGITNFSMATYRWVVYRNDGTTYSTGTFNVVYGATHSRPTPIEPVGATLRYAKNAFKWAMDTNAVQFRLTIRRGATNGPVVLDRVDLAPFREANGAYEYRLPILAGDGAFTNGVYYWQVQGLNPRVNSTPSVFSAFTLDLTDNPLGPYSVYGHVVYPGKVTNSSYLVQAFTSVGCGGWPEAQVTVPNVVSSNQWPLNWIPFALKGLRPGTYYVRAFLDQNNNRRPDAWESKGLLSLNAYDPKALTLPPNASNQQVFVMFADTDNDKIADDWEYRYFTNLTTAGPGPVRGYTDSNGDGTNDYESYAASPLNMSPIAPPGIGPDGVPYRVKAAFGLSAGDWMLFEINDIAAGSSGPVVKWLSPTNGYAYGLPKGLGTIVRDGVTLRFQVQRSADLKTWEDVSDQSPVDFDPNKGEFRFREGQLRPVGFYRLRVFWQF